MPTRINSPLAGRQNTSPPAADPSETPPADARNEPIDLSLFVYGDGAESQGANCLAAVERVCQRLPWPHWRLTVIDAKMNPDQALIQGVIATPTLVVRRGRQTQRIVGGLADCDAVAAYLAERFVPPASTESVEVCMANDHQDARLGANDV